MGENICAALQRNALKYGERLALSYPAGNIAFTWEELHQRVLKLAQHLNEQGVKKGDSVALLIPNRPSFVIALFAVFQLGARAVPINVRLTPNEINYILANSDAISLLCDKDLKEVGLQAAEGTNLRYVEITDNFESIYQASDAGKANYPFASADAAEILYTSGTTGKPKGVILSHNALRSRISSAKSTARAISQCLWFNRGRTQRGGFILP